MGAPTLLFTSPKTMGVLKQPAIGNISCMSATPFALEAVMTRAPAAEAVTQAVMAECSLSTVTKFVSTSPLATNSANFMIISVEGVMGYAATTSGFIWRIASAKAQFPDVISLRGIFFCSLLRELGLRPHLYGLFGAHLGANSATLTVEVVDTRYFSIFIGSNGTVRALNPAKHA